MKRSKNPKKQQQPKKKRGAKVEQYVEEHIESAIWAVFAYADDRLVPNHISVVHVT